MLRIVPHTVTRVGRSYEHFPDGFELYLLRPGASKLNSSAERVGGGVRIHPENVRHGVQYMAQCVACSALTLGSAMNYQSLSGGGGSLPGAKRCPQSQSCSTWTKRGCLPRIAVAWPVRWVGVRCWGGGFAGGVPCVTCDDCGCPCSCPEASAWI